MSTITTVSNGSPRPGKIPPTAAAPAGKSRCRHTPGGAALGKQASAEARRIASAILEVLAGGRTPGQAAETLGMSLVRYFQVETRALHGLIEGCEARPRGRAPNAEKELAALRRQQERLQREVARQQALVRMAQRTIGLAPPPPAAKPAPGKKRRRRPAVRALRAAEQLAQPSQEASPEAAPPAEGTDNPT
jgi:hypothetical protein